MFAGNIMLMPGQELREFVVSRPERYETESGLVKVGGYAEVGRVFAILAQAKSDEIQRWRQLTHAVTHKIIMKRRPDFEIKPGYIFERDGHRFNVHEPPYDVGGLGHWMIFYCEERSDIK